MRLSSELSANRLGRHWQRRMRRTATAAPQWRGREVLPRPEARGNAGARGDGSDRACPLVRALIGGAAVRTVGGRPGADQSGPGAEAEERPARCQTPAQAADRRSLSKDLGAEPGESRRT